MRLSRGRVFLDRISSKKEIKRVERFVKNISGFSKGRLSLA